MTLGDVLSLLCDGTYRDLDFGVLDDSDLYSIDVGEDGDDGVKGTVAIDGEDGDEGGGPLDTLDGVKELMV